MDEVAHTGEQMLNPDEQTRLAQHLREAREYLGLSQEYVAEQLGVPRPSISALETGKRKVSSIELKQLARLYKRPIEYFLGDDDTTLSQLEQDDTVRALFRTARDLSRDDRQQVLRFAQFLRQAGRVPTPSQDETEAT